MKNISNFAVANHITQSVKSTIGDDFEICPQDVSSIVDFVKWLALFYNTFWGLLLSPGT